MRRSQWIAVAATAFLAGGPVAGFPAQSAADSASVTAFYRQWFGSAPQGFAVYASFYATDGSIYPPNSGPVTGRAAIAASFEQARAATTYTVQPQGIGVDEMRFLTPAWVVHRSTLRGQRLPRAGGDPVPFETKYVDLLHRTEDGSWEVAFRMWSDNR